MIRNLKVFGLAITAVLAMSALWAISAQAANPELHCTVSVTNTCTLTGTDIKGQTFTFDGFNYRCNSPFAATLNTKTASVVSSVATSYTNCRAFGVAATVNMEGCTYTFNLVAASRPATANFSIVCPAGKTIVWNFPTLPCTITVPAQDNLPHIVLENSGGAEPTDVVAKFTISGITYTETGLWCPSPGTKNNGTINGESTLEGFNDNGQNQAEGNKVGLHVNPL